MKYLGVVLDERLTFKTHLEQLMIKIERNASYLGKILPNIHEPGHRVRKLYEEVLNSMTIYGVPVWANKERGGRANYPAAPHRSDGSQSI